MKKAIIYSRVSTKDQEREGYSIPAQLRILRDYANRNKLNVIKEFKESESAGKAGRKAFDEMVRLLENDQSIKIVLVEKTDRLYRNFKDHVVVDDLDIEIHFVKDNRIISSNSKPSDKFVHDIETAQARFYLNNLSQEVKKGQDQKARQGKYPGGMVPLGYFRNKLTKEIEIDPILAPIIRHLFSLYSSCEHSIDDLHKESVRLKLTYPRSGRIITRSEIERMLKKVFYTGRFKWKDQIYQGDHPAIVDPILFDQVQDAFTSRSNGKFTKKDFTYNRLMKCGDCGHTITAEIKKSKYIYYHCTGYGKKHKVDYINESKIDIMFSQIVDKVSLPEKFYKYLKSSLELEAGSKKIQTTRERERLEASRDKIVNDMRKSFQAKIDGLIEDKFFTSMHNDQQQQLDAINYRLTNLSSSINENYDNAMKTIVLSYKLKSLYVKSNSGQKRKLLDTILSNCFLKDATLYPTYKNAFNIFAEGIASDNKRGTWDTYRTLINKESAY